MALLQVFAVRDSATGSFGSPMFLVSDGHAMRVFGDEVNRVADDNMLARHPGDFELYKLTTFDTSSGRFAPVDDPAVLFVRAKDLIIKE